MSSFYFSPIGNSQQLSTSGAPLNGGTITTFQAGTSTPQATYADNAGGSPSTTLTLNTYGLPSSPVWLAGGQAYKFVIKDSLGNTIRTLDNVVGIDDAIAITADQKARIPTFSAYASVNQSVTSGVSTKVSFDTKDFDTASAFSASRWTPGVAGHYDLTATVNATVSSGSISVLSVELWKNGVAYARGSQLNASTVTLASVNVTAKLLLSATDYVEVYVVISGTNPTVGSASAPRVTHFSGCMVRAA